MKTSLNKREKYWILYDIGNSAFILLVSTIMPIYFNYLAEKDNVSSVDYLAYWGYAASIATIAVAIIGPITGALADIKGYKNKIFIASVLLGAISCLILGFSTHWIFFIVVFIIAKIGYSASLIYYDSMISDITTQKKMDYVSSRGYALGYIGSCIPFVIGLVLVLFAQQIGITMETAIIISFSIVAIWWVLFTIPLARTYKQKHYVEKGDKVVRNSFSRLITTFKEMRRHKKIFIFLLSYFFYIDGVYTIMFMATAYGEALKLDSTGLLLALLVTQIVAFPSAIIIGRLSSKIGAGNLIKFCIIAYLGITIFAIFLTTLTQFWILAVLVGMFQGGIQALSRSYFAKLTPKDQSGKYFGLFDIFGKGASFLGTMVMAVVAQATDNLSISVGVLAIFFVIGLVLFVISHKTKNDLV